MNGENLCTVPHSILLTTVGWNLKHWIHGKHGQQRQAWREADAERNPTGRTCNQMGDEENPNLTERHDDTPDEEDGEHLSKEKKGHKSCNRVQSRRNIYRTANGLGHGTTSSHYAVEPSKPPPGQRKCLTEPEDLRWDEEGRLYQIKIS